MRGFILTLLIFTSIASAQQVCKGQDDNFSIAYKLISFHPPFNFIDERPKNGKYDDGEDWAWTELKEYAQFTNDSGSTYKALCDGWIWTGWGKPTDACIGYCRSALNLLQAIGAESTDFEAPCKIPAVKVNERRTAGGAIRQECVSCETREYLNLVQASVTKCLAAFAIEAGKKSPGFKAPNEGAR